MLVLLILTLLCGLAVGLARGGTLDALGRVHVARPWLFAGVLIVLAFGRLVGALHSLAWILACVGLVVFAAANHRLPGLPLLCAGVALNAIVIGANGGDMPVSAWGADRAGVAIEDIRDSDFHSVADGDTSLRLLSDIIPLPMPAAAAVVSLGDVVIAAGLGLLGAVAPLRAQRTLQARLAGGLARPRRPPRRPGPPGGEPEPGGDPRHDGPDDRGPDGSLPDDLSDDLPEDPSDGELTDGDWTDDEPPDDDLPDDDLPGGGRPDGAPSRGRGHVGRTRGTGRAGRDGHERADAGRPAD